MEDKVVCPECQERVMPQPMGYTDENGEWELEYTDCPICGHVFR